MREDNIYWVGMDVHADTIQVAAYKGTGNEPELEREYGTDERARKRLVKKLAQLSGGVRCVYEAGPCGYGLQRYLRGNGIRCDVAAPSLIPRKPGSRIKTDVRDARNLGRLYRAGELTLILIPDEEQEAVRNLTRAREHAVEELRRVRQNLGSFLLSQGCRYNEGQHWTLGHMKWIKTIKFASKYDQMVLDEALISLEQAQERLRRLTGAVEEIARTPRYQQTVGALMTLRGVKTITAMTVMAELWDLRRYGKAKAMMAALGLVPGEHSSGAKILRGSITKTGNGYVRRVLVEAAWHYRHRPAVSKAIKARRSGQPPEAVATAQKADARLYRKYRRMIDRGKRTTTAAVAVARELAGFVWALGQAA